MNTDLHTTDPDDWAMTFAFWGTLLVAGALFASVSLAPKLKTLSAHRQTWLANQQRIATLQQQAVELERIAAALEHDPAFAAELARVEFDARRPGEERIAVDSELQLGGEDHPSPASPAAARPPGGTWTIPAFLLEPLATHTTLRASLLALAATLAVTAFLLLHEQQSGTVRLIFEGTRTMTREVLERYRRT